MTEVAIFLPHNGISELTRKIAEQYHLNVRNILVANTADIVEKTREVVASGVDIVIARGTQAMIIKRSTNIPVVTFQLTGQELAFLVAKAKEISGKEMPKIALIGFKNMFSDTSKFNDLFHVQLSKHLIDDPSQLRNVVREALDTGIDVLIGGDIACQYAEQRGIPSIFLACGEESIREACRNAQQMVFALDQEKQKTAELKVILDSTFNSIIHIDAFGKILNLNHSAEQILEYTQQEIPERPIWSIIPSLSKEALKPVLTDGKEIFSLRVKLHGTFYIASASPILLDEQYPNGAIICINEQKQLDIFAATQRNELRQKGYTAHYRFEEVISNSPETRLAISQAKYFARFSTPILIYGEYGTEKAQFAQCIHNASEYAGNAFLHIDCGAYAPDEVDEMLFGRYALAYKAQSVLFLDNIEKLSLSAQHKVFQLLLGQHIPDAPETYSRPLRIIAATTRSPLSLAKDGLLQRDLYYAISIMVIHLSPLRERKADIGGWIKLYLHRFQEQYSRYIYLTKGAQKLLLDYFWPDNLIQLRGLCERLVALSPKRSVDEIFVQEQLNFMPTLSDNNSSLGANSPAWQNPYAAHIQAALKHCAWNRAKTAKYLGISTSTLWRHMKKYGIRADKYSVLK